MIGIKILIGIVCSVNAALDRTPAYEWYKGTAANVIYAVSCGSSEPLTDMDGIVYRADEGYSGGVTSNDGASQRWIIPNTEVYHTERWADEDFSYKIPFSFA